VTTALVIIAIILAWMVLGSATVWFAARFAGSDTALLNFFIWPIAFMGTLCILLGAELRSTSSFLDSVAEHALKARHRSGK